MGHHQRLIDGHFSPDFNRRCRWPNESVHHVYNDCTDLQIQALRDDIRATTGRVLNAECVVNDPITALDFQDRAIGYLHH